MLPWIEVATIAVILVIVALYFRSLGAPLVTLATRRARLRHRHPRAGVDRRAGGRDRAERDRAGARRAAARARHGLHGLLHVRDAPAAARGRLARRGGAGGDGADRAARVRPPGCSSPAGALSLLAGEMQFFRVFGPGLAVAALVVTLVCVTLVPALMALLGPWLFGRRARRGARTSAAAAERARSTRRRRRRAAGCAPAARRARSPRPRRVAALLVVACAGVLVVAAAASADDLAVSFIPSLPPDSEPRQRRGGRGARLRARDPRADRGHARAPGIAARPARSTRLQALSPSSRASPPCSDPRRRRERGVGASSSRADGSGGALRRWSCDDEPTGAAAIDDDPPPAGAGCPRSSRRPGLPRRARVLRGRDGAGAGDGRRARRRPAARRASSPRS